ncbi:MAG: deferrochelatase/peroxidase EfeB [Solirubrobacteraceae bacterium]|jgi:deferrochelatase/peroxidase EfeB|nr:deferrochelatase/peroxidase EfeB [Solirubrobacteraceae bacterium]
MTTMTSKDPKPSKTSEGYAQSGITNRPPEHLLLAALRFADPTPAAARAALDGLAGVVRRELASELDDRNGPADKDRPSAETGELGFTDGYDRAHLTVTLGISASGMDALAVAADERPADLRPIPWEALGDNPAIRDSGDLLLHVCSDDIYVAEHVVRRVEEELGGALAVVWTQLGAQRYTSRPGRTSRREGRALIGFLDGTSNLNPRNSEADRELVFVDPAKVGSYPPNPTPQPGGGGPYPGVGPNFPVDLAPVPTAEPAWTKNGTYMTVRVSTFDTTPWDDRTQNEQERSVGRFKVSGASLDLADDPSLTEAEPAFTADQNNVTVPLDSHVRKSHPRRSPEDQLRRVFRRGYPVIGGAAGGMQRGLAFIGFARTTSTQFEFIFRGWLRNPDFPQPGTGLDKLLFGTLPETVLCGGYYFVPPLRHRTQPWTWLLPDVPATAEAADGAPSGAAPTETTTPAA